MKININGTDVALLGDPHLGKRFINNVPLHRRGEREKRQMELFREKLMNPEAPLHVCMGDIFDKFRVPNEVTLEAAEAYVDAAAANLNTTYVLIMGNHDGSRDVTLKSSFDILEAILAGVPNIMVVRDKPHYYDLNGEDGVIAFIPWHPFKNAQGMADELHKLVDCAAVFGHWDIDDFGGEHPNLLPVETLRPLTNLIITGHVHTAQERDLGDGLQLIVTGSMEPYSHGEDPEGTLYRTVTLAELKELDAKNLCVRVRLEADEVLDFEVDCLQLQVQRADSETEYTEVAFEAFDMEKMFRETMTEFGVTFYESDNFWDRFKAQSGGMV